MFACMAWRKLKGITNLGSNAAYQTTFLTAIVCKKFVSGAVYTS
jgi:hypothetical protein